MDSTQVESELESFRRKWREEVSDRQRPRDHARRSSLSSFTPSRSTNHVQPVAENVASRPIDVEYDGKAFHDLEDREKYLSLERQADRSKGLPEQEPSSALEHYERAVEREGSGKLGESVALYRKAFKLDSTVQEAYKKKHFSSTAPASKPQDPNPSNASPTVPNPAHHSLQGPTLTLNELIDQFSQLGVSAAPPETDLSLAPPCPIAEIPEEVLVNILRLCGLVDVALFSQLAQTCKRFAYLIMTEDSIWKPISQGPQFGVKSMYYRYSRNIRGKLLREGEEDPFLPLNVDLMPSIYPNYRAQFRQRPRIRFKGCYISTVNYTRPGGSSQSRYTWNNPVHIVTYYRYLRFFRDGSCISLQTTSEPADTVHHLTMENVHNHHTGALPSSVMKGALRGRWRLSGAGPSIVDEDGLYEARGPGEYDIEPDKAIVDEEEGILNVETDGVIPKYMWKMQFAIGSSGRKDGTRNNRLTWMGFWLYNRLSDDWGEFGMKHDRPFYWSRVKSYAT